MPKVLLVDNQPNIREVAALLEVNGYEPLTIHDTDTALNALRHHDVDVVVVSATSGEAAAGVLDMIRAGGDSIPVVMVNGDPALNAGKPRAGEILNSSGALINKALIEAISRVLGSRAPGNGANELVIADGNGRDSKDCDGHGSPATKSLGGMYGIVGTSAKMLPIFETIRTTAKSDASVLIEGESGTGKELVAAAFHTCAGQASRPFVHINCAAIPGELMESELFGYRRGAFTGADRDKRGLMAAACEGTLLLDEITEIPLHLQAKLLRVLQERKLRRLGDEREIPVNFRLISATNRDTQQALKEGLLREDLYFRIGTIRIKVPPLRERLEDLVPLTEHFRKLYGAKYKRTITGVSQEAIRVLAGYDWPGNVRELESVIERAVLFCTGGEIGARHLPENFRLREPAAGPCEIPPFWTLEQIEREAICQTLVRTGGNVKKAAQLLDVPRPTFYRKLRKLGLASVGARHHC